MSFGNMLRELCCSGFAKKAAEDLAEQYGGESGKNFIGGVLDGDNQMVKNLMGAMSGKQQLSVQNLASMVQSQGGEALLQVGTLIGQGLGKQGKYARMQLLGFNESSISWG